jgi:hypothetical protein
MRWAGHVAGMREINAYKILGGKIEGKRQLGRPRCRWEHNIRMNLRGMGPKVNCMYLARDRNRWQVLVNTELTFGFHKRRGIS